MRTCLVIAVVVQLAGGVLLAGELDPRPLSGLPVDVQPLVKALQAHGFRVQVALPPRPGVYGQFEPRSRTLWVSPLSLELGIGRQTFLHEAVHAVQSCPAGVVSPIGWSLPLDPAVERGINVVLYHGYPTNKAVEREAFALQGQSDAVPLLLEALRRRCR
jgi:hypothetical protein